jgi:hypothetical protein
MYGDKLNTLNSYMKGARNNKVGGNKVLCKMNEKYKELTCNGVFSSLLRTIVYHVCWERA